VALIFIPSSPQPFTGLLLQDCGYCASVSRDVSVYLPAFAGTHFVYPGGMARLS